MAGKVREVAFAETVVVLPQGRQASGRQRQLDQDRAHGAGWHFVAALIDDAEIVARPSLTAMRPSPSGLPVIAQPVSVCHQWSRTGTLRSLSAHVVIKTGVDRPPA